MVTHYNNSITENFYRIFNLKGESAPLDVDNIIYPVIQVESRLNIVKSINKTTSGGTTIYTTPLDKDFYLTGIHLSYVKDAACDLATGAIFVSVTIDGVLTSILQLATLITTAQAESEYLNFDKPLKLDRGTTITLGNNTFAAGACPRAGSIFGYTQETTKGV